ncbi:MAG TPA: hypothetical protein VGV64_02340 [Thermoplasmata archaeon]|nr:hypothetical protein [Thermoplasmata archaeon]
MAVCSNCGASDFVWANRLGSGMTGGGGLSLRGRRDAELGTRICRSCGHADLFLRDLELLRSPHRWKPGEFIPINEKTVRRPAPPLAPTPAPTPAPETPAPSPSPSPLYVRPAPLPRTEPVGGPTADSIDRMESTRDRTDPGPRATGSTEATPAPPTASAVEPQTSSTEPASPPPTGSSTPTEPTSPTDAGEPTTGDEPSGPSPTDSEATPRTRRSGAARPRAARKRSASRSGDPDSGS